MFDSVSEKIGARGGLLIFFGRCNRTNRRLRLAVKNVSIAFGTKQVRVSRVASSKPTRNATRNGDNDENDDDNDDDVEIELGVAMSAHKLKQWPALRRTEPARTNRPKVWPIGLRELVEEFRSTANTPT